jgi:hypothetical protein
MTSRSITIYAAALACILGGCSQDGTLSTGLNTGSVDSQQATAAKSQDALCLTLASQIEALNTDGTSDKVAKAAAKKYKLKATDLSKADELNKANSEFQTKCSSYPPRVAATAPIEPVATSTTTTTTTTTTPKVAAAKTKPPVPSPKPLAAAMAPQETTTQASSAPVADNPPVQSP